MAWTAIGARPASPQAVWKAAASADLVLGGRHICGELAKICTASQPIEAALLGMPFRPPPETCAPRRTRAVLGRGNVATEPWSAWIEDIDELQSDGALLEMGRQCSTASVMLSRTDVPAASQRLANGSTRPARVGRSANT